ncbi:MAG: efflux transporter outer membrane subunit [Puniceicoccaceae bacterium]
MAFSKPIRRIVAALVLAVLGLAGCTVVGPDFQEPDIAGLQAWEGDLYGQFGRPAGGESIDLQFWWRVFNDPVLEELIELARRESPTLQLAGLRILESRASLGLADSARSPQVRQATGAITYVNSLRSGAPDTDFVSAQAGLNAGWELDFWGKYQRGVEAADAAFMASIANQQNAQVLLAAQVADLYFAYRTTLLRIAIAESNASIQARSFEITRKLFEGGEQSELDLQQAKTQYMSTLSTLPGLEISKVQLRNALCVLLGRAPSQLPELDEETVLLPEMDPVALQDVPLNYLLRRPDVRASVWLVAAQTAKVGLAGTDLYPSVSLLGSLGWSDNSMAGSASTVTLGIGPAIQWNIFDGGLIRNNIRIEDARLQQAIVSFQNAVLLAAQEIDNAAISVVKTREQKEPQKASTAAARRSLELANSRYREGLADFQRVIDAQRAVAAQAERELLNDSSHISAVISLYKSIGGGWLDMPVDQLIPESVRTSMEERTDWADQLRKPMPDGTLSPASTEESPNE